MRRTKYLATLLAMTLLLLQLAAPLALAVDSASAPYFTAELVTSGDQPGIYGTVHNAPSDLSMAAVLVSYGGLQYDQTHSSIWFIDEPVPEGSELTRLCFSIDEIPVAAYLSGAVNSLYLKLEYFVSDSYEKFTTEAFRISHGNTYDPPQQPPAFSMEVDLSWSDYSLVGHFSDFAPNVAQIRPTYSWDGVHYQYPDSEFPTVWDQYYMGNPDKRDWLEHQVIGRADEEPLRSFLSGAQDSFYVRLEITTEDLQVYHSQPARYSRSARQPLPEYLAPRVSFGFDFLVIDEDLPDHIPDPDVPHRLSTSGQLQLTVRDDATSAQVQAMLPDTVPIRVKLWDRYSKTRFAYADLDCPVTWKPLPDFSLTAGESLTLEDVAQPLEIPAGTDLVTDLGTFTLQAPLSFKSAFDHDDIRLILNPVSPDDGPRVVLRGYNYDLANGENGWDDNVVYPDDPLSLAFWEKPTGATSIKAYAVAGDTQTDTFELLDRRSIDHNQSHALYGYIPLLQFWESPYMDYLDRAIDSFSVVVTIEGGVYDGQQVVLPFPAVDDLPQEVPDPHGIDGDENNAGSGYEEIEGETGNNGGQRPWLPRPDDGAPPAITKPPDEDTTPPEEKPEPPVTPEPEVHPDPVDPAQPQEDPDPAPPMIVDSQGPPPAPPQQGAAQQPAPQTPANEPAPTAEPPAPSAPAELEATPPILSVAPPIAHQSEPAAAGSPPQSRVLPLVLTAAALAGAATLAIGGSAIFAADGTGAARRLLSSLKRLLHK